MQRVVGNYVDTLTSTVQLDKICTEPAACKPLSGLSKDKARSNTLSFGDLFNCYIVPVTQCSINIDEVRVTQIAYFPDHVWNNNIESRGIEHAFWCALWKTMWNRSIYRDLPKIET